MLRPKQKAKYILDFDSDKKKAPIIDRNEQINIK